MNHYSIKSIIYIALASGMIACSSGLNKKYQASSKEEDYIKISKQISSEELQLLKDYILKSEAENADLSDCTYQGILNIAKLLKEEEMEQKRRQAEMEKKKAEEEKIIQQKTELLCNKNWEIKNVEYILNSGMKLQMTEPAIKALYHNGKYRKIYASDGTYKEIMRKKEIQKGTWKFINPDRIIETRPSKNLYSSLNNNTSYLLTIDTLNEQQFNYIEKTSQPGYSSDAESTKLIKMTVRKD